MKFRVIQSNDRGLISKVGDKTFYSRKPKKGEENLELPTLFIWVKKPYRYAARVWTKWTGEKFEKDYIYIVTKFKNIIDISGLNYFHQWSNQSLRLKLWEMKGEEIKTMDNVCPRVRDVWEGNRNKKSIYINRRKTIIKNQTLLLSKDEILKIKNLYKAKNDLNFEAGYIKYHIDHIKPLSKGGLHCINNIRIVNAEINLKKGSKII